MATTFTIASIMFSPMVFETRSPKSISSLSRQYSPESLKHVLRYSYSPESPKYVPESPIYVQRYVARPGP